jgi:hypothetical protein
MELINDGIAIPAQVVAINHGEALARSWRFFDSFRGYPRYPIGGEPQLNVNEIRNGCPCLREFAAAGQP